MSEVFPFEDLPAQDRRVDHVYLDEVRRHDVYLGLFGNEYGFEDPEGVSPTEREYDEATHKGETRLIYVWGSDGKRIDWFLEKAGRERGFPLKASTTTQALLTHLSLIEDGAPTNAAVLLFGSNPQKFHRTAETKCVHCHGTEYRRPFASQQIYEGNLFEQVDQARDFVLSKLNRPVGTRDVDSTAPAGYELPPEAVGEAIVDAVAHRDYHSNGSVEIRLFSDRLEVWNPGMLPGQLTPASLETDHPSIPYNPLLTESLYLARYIEKAGSGTQAMIQGCREADLPDPQFEVRQGSIIVTLWRSWLTDCEFPFPPQSRNEIRLGGRRHRPLALGPSRRHPAQPQPRGWQERDAFIWLGKRLSPAQEGIQGEAESAWSHWLAKGGKGPQPSFALDPGTRTALDVFRWQMMEPRASAAREDPTTLLRFGRLRDPGI